METPPRGTKRHLLFIRAERMTLLAWGGGCMSLIGHFAHDEEAFDKFSAYMAAHSKIPCVVIVDLIEEDYKMETVVHVRGADRAALLNRRMTSLFRTTPYRYASIIGRETSGRKDDKAVLTALTKPDLIDPWVSRLLAKRVPILAISSAAYLMEKLAELLKLNKLAQTLIVTLESDGSMRQTYLQNGQLIFSRLTRAQSLELDLVGKVVRDQCDQTCKYLARIKVLLTDASLPVHVYLSEDVFVDPLTVQLENVEFFFHSARGLVDEASLNLDELAPSVLFFLLAFQLKKNEVANIYASTLVRRYYYLFSARRVLYVLSALVVMAAAATSAPLVGRIAGQTATTTSTLLDYQNLELQYQQLRNSFTQTPIPAVQMVLVVSTYDAILKQMLDMNRSLSDISNSLLVSPNLRLTQIAWQLVEDSSDAVSAVDEYGFEESEESRYQRNFVNGRLSLMTTIHGRINSAISFREVDRLIDDFSRALEQQTGGVVAAVRMPLNMSVNERMDTVVDGGNASGEFVLELTERFAHDETENQ